MANPTIIVDFKADTSGLQSGLKGAGGAADDTKGRLGGMGKAAVVAAGAAGLGALVATAKLGFDELKEGATVSAQTEAVLKSTGGAAGRTAEQFASLAESLSKQSGIDDEVIQGGENILATFKKIQGTTFDQATASALDMSVALGVDMKTASMTLGKALNDPVKGVGRLAKAGVDFTDQQKAQIEAMVEAGDVAGAQGIILEEVASQVGGSAEAYGSTVPGELAKAQNSFEGLAGEVMGVFVPAMSAIATVATEHPALFKAIVIGVLALAAALVVLNVVMAVTTALGIALTWPILAIVAGIIALIAVIVLVIVYWDTIMAAGVAAWNAIKGAAETAWNWIKGNWPLILAVLTGPFGLAVVMIIRYWDQIKAAVGAVVNWIKGVWSAITGALSSAMSAAAGAISGAWDRIKAAVGAAIDFLRSMWSAYTGFIGALMSAAVGAVAGAWNRIKSAATGVIDAIKAAWEALVGTVSGIVGRIKGFADTAKAAVNFVIDRWNSLSIPGIHIKVPGPGPLPDLNLNWGGWDSPNIGRLAKGGIVTRPMLSWIGEAGPEAVIPLSGSQPAIEVRVFIGDTELRGMVRTEIVDQDTRTARTILAGAR